MKKIYTLVLVLPLLLAACSERLHAVVVGVDLGEHSVDIRMDDGDVKFIEMSGEQFYSMNSKIGDELYVSCFDDRCFVVESQK